MQTGEPSVLRTVPPATKLTICRITVRPVPANIDGLLEDSDLSKEEREKILDSVRKWEKESGAAEVRIRHRESELIELNIELGVLKSNSQFL